MRYFNYLTDCDRESLFFQSPGAFSKRSDRAVLRKAVGGLLYIPAANPDIAQIILSGKIKGLTSMAVCLEDSVGDQERDACVENVERQFGLLAAALEDGKLSESCLPLLFVRVKDIPMLERLAEFFIRYSRVITGVILPKTTRESLELAMPIVRQVNGQTADPFYAMPILESEELVLCEDQTALLQALKATADRYCDQILNIRMGATDLCGLYGIRRNVDTPVYSIALMASTIASIVRVFGLGDRYTVSGPVWEYYSSLARNRALQRQDEVDGLLKEVSLDLQNGILGKTCVHPSQLLPVQASYVVPYEMFQDANGVLNGDQGRHGVMASTRRNKMNELKPHTLWAGKILQQAQVYGVYQENTSRDGFLRAVCSGEPYQ